MLYRGPMGGGAASGKMGAMVAARNKGGQYLRARSKPSGAVASEFQQVVRNALGTLATLWSSTLDDDQRNAWGVYASNVLSTNRLGDSIQLSGENWFIACNTPRLQAELPVVLDAPTTFDRGTTLFPVLSASESGGTVTIAFGGTVTAAANLIVYGGLPFSKGRKKYYGSRRFANTFDLTTGQASAAFVPPFPLPDANSQMEFQLVVSQDDGRLSTPLGVTFLGS